MKLCLKAQKHREIGSCFRQQRISVPWCVSRPCITSSCRFRFIYRAVERYDSQLVYTLICQRQAEYRRQLAQRFYETVAATLPKSSFRLFGKSAMTAGCFLRFEWKAECDPFRGVSTLQSLTGYIHPKKIAAFVSTSRDGQSYLPPPLPPCLSQRTTRFFNYLAASSEANCSFENFISSSALLFREKSANWPRNAIHIHIHFSFFTLIGIFSSR